MPCCWYYQYFFKTSKCKKTEFIKHKRQDSTEEDGFSKLNEIGHIVQGSAVKNKGDFLGQPGMQEALSFQQEFLY